MAGNETTTNLIGNGMLALLQNPAQRREMQDDPSLLPAAVEEMLRYDGPVQMTSRVATDRRGATGPQDRDGAGCPGDGRRRPTTTRTSSRTDPDAFDIHRAPGRHFAFGHGIHYCIGAPLALAEAEETLRALLRRLPEPEAAFEAPDWARPSSCAGLKSLPVV